MAARTSDGMRISKHQQVSAPAAIPQALEAPQSGQYSCEMGKQGKAYHGRALQEEALGARV